MKVLQIHDKEFTFNSISNTGPDSYQNGYLGGVSIYLSHLVPALKDRGWEVSMIRFTPRAIQQIKVAENSYELKAFGYHLRLTVLASLLHIIKKENPDIVHCNSSWQWKGIIAAKLAGTKIVWHLNDTKIYWFIRVVFKFLSKKVDGFIVEGRNNKRINTGN